MEKQNIYEKPMTLENILKFAVPIIAVTAISIIIRGKSARCNISRTFAC